MIRVDPFHPHDLAAITVQAAQTELPADRIAHGMALAAAGPCFTIRAEGRDDPLFCGGAFEQHAELASLWAVVAADAGPFMRAITRRTRWFIAKLSQRRVDTNVVADFAAGRRWVGMLGFEPEARLRDFYANGDDAMIYRLQRDGGR